MILSTLTRKTLLYRSKVEYGGWTINHVQGCSHGCRYPCYAMLLARRTGRVAGYDEWVTPRIVENTMELLESELRHHRGQIDSVHMSFTTDPFMYDCDQVGPNADICLLTLQVIERLNAEGVAVTTLTKGIYPAALGVTAGLSLRNSYGISLVSLSENFRAEWEPFAAPVQERIAALQRMSELGYQTWVSIEPYPTPNIDSTASDVEMLLERVAFADAFVFGKWNYNAKATAFDREHDFYADIAERVQSWCEARKKALHIKRGTPFANDGFLGVPGCVPTGK